MNKTFSFLMLLMAQGACANTTSSLYAPQKLGPVAVHLLKTKHMMIQDKDGVHPVERYNMDKNLRDLSPEDLAKLLDNGAYLAVDKFKDSDEYNVKLKARLNGGGLAGATIGCWAGRLGTYAVYGVGITVASACTGPAAPATFYALTQTLAPVAAYHAEINAIAGGIAGGVATGPV